MPSRRELTWLAVGWACAIAMTWLFARHVAHASETAAVAAVAVLAGAAAALERIQPPRP